MTPQTRTSLKELQNLDQEIAALQAETQSFEPLLEEVDAPVLRLEQEVKALEKRLTEIRLEENRIELTIEERKVRVAKLQERMDAVRNVREEAAVHAELEMVRRALESEENRDQQQADHGDECDYPGHNENPLSLFCLMNGRRSPPGFS